MSTHQHSTPSRTFCSEYKIALKCYLQNHAGGLVESKKALWQHCPAQGKAVSYQLQSIAHHCLY